MKKFLVPTCLILCIIGIFALWYFGHQRADPKELKSESKNSLPIENHLQEESSAPEVVQKTDKDDTDGEIETKRDNSNPEKTNTDGSTDKNVVLEGEKEHQKLPSAEDVAAANAFEVYVKTDIEFDLATGSLKEALETRPIDWDHVKSATSDHKNARLRRKEALQNLASYSEAAEILAAEETLSAEDAARIAAMKEKLDRDEAEMRKQTEEMRNQIFDGLSPEQQRTLLDTFPELKELLSAD